MKRTMLLIALCLCLSACGTYWKTEYVPMTSQERTAVAEHEKSLVTNQIQQLSLAGKNQEWTDAIVKAHNVALESCCEPRFFEYRHEDQSATGRWKGMDGVVHGSSHIN